MNGIITYNFDERVLSFIFPVSFLFYTNEKFSPTNNQLYFIFAGEQYFSLSPVAGCNEIPFYERPALPVGELLNVLWEGCAAVSYLEKVSIRNEFAFSNVDGGMCFL